MFTNACKHLRSYKSVYPTHKISLSIPHQTNPIKIHLQLPIALWAGLRCAVPFHQVIHRRTLRAGIVVHPLHLFGVQGFDLLFTVGLAELAHGHIDDGFALGADKGIGHRQHAHIRLAGSQDRIAAFVAFVCKFLSHDNKIMNSRVFRCPATLPRLPAR